MMERMAAAGYPGCESSCDEGGLNSSPLCCPSCRCVARDCDCGNLQAEERGAMQKRTSSRWPNSIARQDSACSSYVPTIRGWLWRWHRRYRFGEQQEDQVLNVNSDHNRNSSISSSSSSSVSQQNLHHSKRLVTKCLHILIFLILLQYHGVLGTPLQNPNPSRSPNTYSPYPVSIKPKWINPCGISPSAMKKLASNFGAHYEVTPLSDRELLENVILAARNALKHSKYFKEDYVKKTFRTSNWWEHHETWRDMRYDWLPSWNQIPKHLHEKTSRGHLEQLQVDRSLKNIYRFLQRLSVGLEQIVFDQNMYDGRFMEEFNEAEFKLKAVLCELEIAMMEKGITVKREDPGQGPITRSIMSDAIRDIEDESYRNLRDWYIYRDYMNSLEYVVHSFDHLKRKTHRGGRRGH